ncbi:hypothetical protein A3L02_02495 [Thermococcus celer Vu 13 = JCM 8558]|uniref:Class III signal peptide-containing protein n=1 Tax=Thermococcus celer Vu 13 = JCM 8558 TaxID=1293037 RepID=A0A218P0R8_THECE|nr:hypothetical protein A3L02_02495 [Thermococcus celer Vu 13 = JCM 8558]
MRRSAQSSLEYILMFATGLLLVLFVVKFLKTDPHRTGSQLLENEISGVSQALSELQNGG